MRQQTSSGEREVEVMGKRFVVLPEVFNVSTLQPILEYIAHSPLKIIADELKKRGPEARLDILEIGPHGTFRSLRCGFGTRCICDGR